MKRAVWLAAVAGMAAGCSGNAPVPEVPGAPAIDPEDAVLARPASSASEKSGAKASCSGVNGCTASMQKKPKPTLEHP